MTDNGGMNWVTCTGSKYKYDKFYLGVIFFNSLLFISDIFLRQVQKKLTGYTSWYNHYQNINEKLICDALENCSSEYFTFFRLMMDLKSMLVIGYALMKQNFPMV